MKVVGLGLILTLLCVAASATLVPTHVYLTLTGDTTQIQVTFTTTSKPTTASVAYWPEDNTSVNHTVVELTAADVHSFTRPVTSIVDYINTVTLTGLQRGVYYNYQITGDVTNAATKSDVFRFRNVPEDGKPVTIGIYGDMGAYGYALVQKSADGLPKWAQGGKFDIIVHNGDLAYNLGTDNGTVGDEFMENLQQVSAYVPYMVTPGNHEFMNDGQDEKYYNNFWLGQNLLGENSKSNNTRMWYSFDIGTVHVVGISTEVYCEDTTHIKPQYEWLENDLKTTRARTDNPWILVLGHRPLYSGVSSFLHARLMRQGLQCTDATLTDCDTTKSCESGKNCAYSIELLLEKYKVTMFNAGHEHTYIRNNPIARNLTYEVHPNKDIYKNPANPLYIISGAAGTAHTPSDDDLRLRSPLAATPQVLETATNAFSTFVAYNASHGHYTQVSAVDGAILDEFWIIRDKSAPQFKYTEFTLDKDTQTACDQ